MLCLENEPLQYDSEYWKNVNKYRLPGTTVNDKERPCVTIAQKNEYLSGRDFVGTLAAGKTGISVMQLESYHFDGNLDTQRIKTLTPYGGPLPKHDCTLTANKSYFFLDGYTVCLGSAINAENDNATVYTVVENRKGKAIIENGKVTGYAPCEVTVNGEEVRVPSEDTVYENVNSLTVGKTAYIPLEKTNLVLRTTDTAPSFTEVLWKHGIDPKGDTYAYAILPDGANAEKFANACPVTVLCNDETAQIVRVNETGDTYCVFHTACEKCGISVDMPLLVAVKQDGIFICDATQKAEHTCITVNGDSFCVTFKDNTTVKVK